MSETATGSVLRIGKFFIVTFERGSGGTVSFTVEAHREDSAVSLAMDGAFSLFPSERLRLFLVREAKLYSDGNATVHD